MTNDQFPMTNYQWTSVELVSIREAIVSRREAHLDPTRDDFNFHIGHWSLEIGHSSFPAPLFAFVAAEAGQTHVVALWVAADELANVVEDVLA